jgi:acyl-CoA dehydrogenase
VFVPLDTSSAASRWPGKGWRMLVQQLTIGRCIVLPSRTRWRSSPSVWATGAYARIRKQFNLPIGKFQGVGRSLARMAGHGVHHEGRLRRDVTGAERRRAARGAVGDPEVPQYRDGPRQVANDAMDVHGGKAIMLGPKNYLAALPVVPISITVEGANILTRNLIIFGQGAIRCHPYVLKEMEAARDEDRRSGSAFDRALFGHIGYALSNACAPGSWP